MLFQSILLCTLWVQSNPPRFRVWNHISFPGKNYQRQHDANLSGQSIIKSKIGDATTIAPITACAPSERLVLRSAYFAGLWVLLALELRLQSLRRIGVKFATTAVRLNPGLWGLVDLRSTECAS